MKTKLTRQVIALALTLDNLKTRSQVSIEISAMELKSIAYQFTDIAGGEEYFENIADQDTPEINFLNFLEQARVEADKSNKCFVNSIESSSVDSSKIERLLMKSAKEFSDWVSVVQDCPTNSSYELLNHATDQVVDSILFYRENK